MKNEKEVVKSDVSVKTGEWSRLTMRKDEVEPWDNMYFMGQPIYSDRQVREREMLGK